MSEDTTTATQNVDGANVRQKAPPDVLAALKAKRTEQMAAESVLTQINNAGAMAAAGPSTEVTEQHEAVMGKMQARGGRKRGTPAGKVKYAFAGRGHRLYIPIWVNTVYEHKKTQMLVADIVLVPLGDMFNSGKGIDHFIHKGYKHLEEVPEEVANYDQVLKHIQARNALIEAEMKQLDKQRELVALGVLKPRVLERPDSHIALYNWYTHHVKKQST